MEESVLVTRWFDESKEDSARYTVTSTADDDEDLYPHDGESSAVWDLDDSTMGEEYYHRQSSEAMFDQPSWIQDLEPTLSSMEPTLFPYHISSGYSYQAFSRRMSGSTIFTNTDTGNNPDKLEKAMEVLKIRLLLQKIHKSHLERSRPSVQVVRQKKASQLRTQDLFTNLPKDNPKVLEMGRLESQITKTDQRDTKRLLKLHKRQFWLALEVQASQTAHAALRRVTRLRSRLQKRTSVGDKEEDAYSYLLLGKAQLDLGQPDLAISNFQQALDIWISLSNHKGSSKFYAHLFHFQSENAADSMDLGDTLCLMGQAQVAMPKNHKRLALSSFQKALTIYKREKAHASIAMASRGIGQVHGLDGDYDLAIKVYQESLEFQKQHLGSRHVLVGDALMAVGDCYRQRKVPHKAGECYQEALSIFREVLGDHHELVANALVALGDLYCKEEGQEEQALSYYGEVHLCNSSVLSEHVKLKAAILLFQQGQTDLALAKFRDIIAMCQEHDSMDSKIYFSALVSSAVCHFVEGSKDDARKCFKDAIRMSQGSSLFVQQPVIEKLLKVSLGKVDHDTRFGRAFNGIKRTVLLKQDNDNALDQSDLETIQESVGDPSWYYFLENDPFGNLADGWHPFEINAGLQLEDIYQSWMSKKPGRDPQPQQSFQPVISIESNGFLYDIDLENMTQTNALTGRIRPIQRSLDGRVPAARPSAKLSKLSTHTLSFMS